MTDPWRVTADDPADLAFALDCLTAGAVSFAEFRDWACLVIGESDDPPLHLVAVLDVPDGHAMLADAVDVLGFWPSDASWPSDAVDGIAYARFPRHRSDAVGRVTAERTFAAHPSVLARFGRCFPDGDLPGELARP
ncbi:MAG TPA: hypothetical protein VGE77_03005 [Nocardioides sp.]